MDNLLQRHRKELRDLQSRITQKKKQATKKNRKQVNAECDQLEAETKARHQREVQALEDPSSVREDQAGDSEAQYIPPPSDSEGAEQAQQQQQWAEVSTPPENAPASSSATASRPKKPNRHKARLARRAAEIEAAATAAEEEAASLPNLRGEELATIQEFLDQHSLSEKAVEPNGHCLYSAFAHGLSEAGVDAPPDSYKAARRRCAEFMRANRDDFAPFLEEDFDEHVNKVEGTAEWGGQTEVLALGRAFNVKVNVVQAEGRGVERMNEDADGGEIWLAYYRHAFGLGEHYNSLVKRDKQEAK